MRNHCRSVDAHRFPGQFRSSGQTLSGHSGDQRQQQQGARPVQQATKPYRGSNHCCRCKLSSSGRDAGQSNVITAGGDVDALIEEALQHCVPGDGRLLYVSGVQTTGDLEHRLGERGHEVDRVVGYEAVAAEKLPMAAVSAISGQNAAGVILYSPRTALIWCSLVIQANLADKGAHLIHYCLSDNVAAAIRKAYGTHDVTVIADEPNEPAMIAAILKAERARGGSSPRG